MPLPTILSGNVASAIGGAYEVANSCRFNDGDSAYMSKSQSDGNEDVWTLSMWIKRGQLGTSYIPLFQCPVDGSNGTYATFYNTDQLEWVSYTSNSVKGALKTNRVFRDPSAWYHLVFRYESTNGTAGNRMRLYVNGVEETSFATDTNPSSGDDMWVNSTSANFYLGYDNASILGGSATYFDGYMAEVCLIDGSALAPTSFGEFDDDSPTIWKPIDVSGLTFGTNGFYLDFEASGNLGNDANGGTDLTESGLAAADQATDTPTNNFCTLNPLSQMNSTFSEGNNYVVTGGNNSEFYSTFGLTSGKWVWEVKHIGGDMAAGITIDTYINGASQTMGGNTTSIFSYLYYSAGGSSGSVNRFVYNSSNVYNIPSGFGDDTDDTIYQFLLDLDSGTKTFKIRRAGDAASEGSIDINSALLGGDHIFIGYSVQATWPATTHAFNFGGCPAFSISSGNADANGYGNFEYAVPSGYYALCTKNLAEFG